MATISSEKNIIVVGAGWAGLSCAYRLAKKGYDVTVLEAAPQCGGRARSVYWPAIDAFVDNGQHVLIGAYAGCLGILRELGLKTVNLFKSLSPHNFLFQPHPPDALHRPPSRGELAKLVFQLPLLRGKLALASRGMCSVDVMPRLIQTFWEPLFVAALTTPLETASATYASNILRDISFFGPKSKLLIPKVPLSDIFANPVSEWLTQRGHAVLCKNRVQTLLFDSNNHCIGAKTAHQTFLGKVVLAVHPRAALNLLPITDHHHKTLTYQPITTIYYAYSRDSTSTSTSRDSFAGSSMIPVIKQNYHYWLFASCKENCLIFSAVLSGYGEYLNLDKQLLLDSIQADIEALHPNLGPLRARKHIQEKFAAFTADQASHAARPPYQTNTRNLWRCGDYTYARYPATLEGAVRSGLECADSVIHCP